MNNKNEMLKYIEKRMRESGIDVPTIEELDGFLGEWAQIKNSRALEHFEGYSPSEMQAIMYNLFGENCPIQFAGFTDEDAKSVPLFNQVKMLLEIIEKEGDIKLTKTGNLPVRIVKEIYSAGVSDFFIKSGFVNLRIEKDSASVQMARIAAGFVRAVKVRNNKLSLTKHGTKLLTNNCHLLTELLTVMLRRFNLAYFDNYSSEKIGGLGIGFTLILLNKYGKTDQKDTFYTEKYFKAFPLLIDEIKESYMPQDIIASNCYSLRIFDILFYHLGLVTIDETDSYKPTHKKIIHRTDLFERLFKF